jgi:hypothetical protein
MKKIDYIEAMRDAAGALATQKQFHVHFPELITKKDLPATIPDARRRLADGPEDMVQRAAAAIAKHGHSDKGHQVSSHDIAALIYYIADMMGD